VQQIFLIIQLNKKSGSPARRQAGGRCSFVHWTKFSLAGVGNLSAHGFEVGSAGGKKWKISH